MSMARMSGASKLHDAISLSVTLMNEPRWRRERPLALATTRNRTSDHEAAELAVDSARFVLCHYPFRT